MCLPCTRFRVSCHGFYQNCILLLTPKETFGLQKKKFYLANSSSHFQVAISRQSKWAQSTYSVRKWKENISDFSLRQKSNNSEIIARYNWERRVKFQQVFFILAIGACIVLVQSSCCISYSRSMWNTFLALTHSTQVRQILKRFLQNLALSLSPYTIWGRERDPEKQTTRFVYFKTRILNFTLPCFWLCKTLNMNRSFTHPKWKRKRKEK